MVGSTRRESVVHDDAAMAMDLHCLLGATAQIGAGLAGRLDEDARQLRELAGLLAQCSGRIGTVRRAEQQLVVTVRHFGDDTTRSRLDLITRALDDLVAAVGQTAEFASATLRAGAGLGTDVAQLKLAVADLRARTSEPRPAGNVPHRASNHGSPGTSAFD